MRGGIERYERSKLKTTKNNKKRNVEQKLRMERKAVWKGDRRKVVTTNMATRREGNEIKRNNT